MKWKDLRFAILFWGVMALVLGCAVCYHNIMQFGNQQELERRESALLRFENYKLLNYGVYLGVYDSNGRLDGNK